MSFKSMSVALVARALLCGSAAAFTVAVAAPAVAQTLTEAELAAQIQTAVTALLASNPNASATQVAAAIQTTIAASGASPQVAARATTTARQSLGTAVPAAATTAFTQVVIQQATSQIATFVNPVPSFISGPAATAFTGGVPAPIGGLITVIGPGTGVVVSQPIVRIGPYGSVF